MPILERKARAFVKVQDGCNSHCTYCIVPAARGPQRSRSVRAIVDEINLLYRLGYREAVLTREYRSAPTARTGTARHVASGGGDPARP